MTIVAVDSAMFILPLENCAGDREVIGGKGLGLWDLQNRGVSIPPTAVIPTAVYEAIVRPAGLPAAEVLARIDKADLTDLMGVVAEFLGKNFAAGSFAVRSSANLEDAADKSYAGQYESYLDVPIGGLDRAIRDCWRSLWSDSAVNYRDGIGTEARMAVVIQPFIRGRLSGVTFSINPVTGNPFELVFNYTAGDCSAVTDGEGGTRVLTLPLAKALLDDQVEEPFRSVAAVCSLFEHPVDVEWTMDEGGRLHVLQARPVVVRDRYRIVTPIAEWRQPSPEPFSRLGISIELGRNRIYREVLRDLVNPRFHRPLVFVHGIQYMDEQHDSLRYSKPRVAVKFLRALCRVPGYSRKRQRVLQGTPRDDRSQSATNQLVTMIRDYWSLYRTSIYVGYTYNLITGLLGRYVEWLTSRHEDGLVYNLLTYKHSIVNERDDRLARLAQGFQRTSRVDWLGQQSAEFQQAFDRYVEEFGYVFSATNPTDPYGSVDAALAYQLLDAYHETRVSVPRPEYGAEIRAQIAERRFGRLHLVVLDLLLRLYQVVSPIKEDRNHVFYTAIGKIRKFIDRNRARLATELSLADPEDVYFLSLAEITGNTFNQRVVTLRRTMFRLAHRYTDRTPALRAGAPANLEGGMRGVPCSPGRATGRVVVVRTRDDFLRVRPGDILVTDNVRPFWTPIIRQAGGLLTSDGSLLSHGAAIAREYGIPAVFGLGAAVFTLQEGQVVTIDGTAGAVLPVDTIGE